MTETIRAVGTQGRQDAAEWVKTYRLAYSRDGKSYYSYISRTNVSTHAEREREAGVLSTHYLTETQVPNHGKSFLVLNEAF